MGILSTIEDIWDSITEFFHDLFHDPYKIKRMQLLLGMMGVIVIYHVLGGTSLPEGIEAQSNDSCEFLYGRNGDTVQARKGLNVNILGYRKAASNRMPTYWVDTEDGERGEVPQIYFDTDFYAIKNIDSLDIKIADKVKITPNRRNRQLSTLTTDDGRHINLDMRQMEAFVTTRVDEELSDYKRGAMDVFMSRNKFEFKFIGGKMKPKFADYIRKYGADSTVVRYGIKVVSKTKEHKGMFNPVVCYNSEGIAESYWLDSEGKMGTNAKLLSYIPLSGFILDNLGFIVQSKYGFVTQYSPTTIAKDNTALTIFTYVMAFIVSIFGLIWLFVTNQIFCIIVYSILPLRKPLAPFSNRALHKILVTLYWITTYIWVVLLLAYGTPWWIFVPALFFTSNYFDNNFYEKLVKKPVFRCDKCKEIGTKYQESRKYIKSYIKTEYQRVKDGISHDEEKVEKYVMQPNNFSKKVTQRISSTTVHYTTYELKFNIDVFGATYVCNTCKNSEYVIEEDRSLISKRAVSQHSEKHY